MENSTRTKEFVRAYSGSDLIRISDSVYTPIVDGIIHRGDLVMMSGKYKANKSTFAMQLACSVTSGAPFLGTFKVPTPGIVWYFSTEGKDEEMKERLLRMSKAVPVDLSRFHLFCSSQLKVNTPQGLKYLRDLAIAHKNELPVLAIFDSLFSCFKGKLTDESIVNEYITTLRGFSELCNDASIFLFHHLRKPSKDKYGNEIPQTDEDSHGSVFFGGQADHIFTIEKMAKSKMDRLIKCDTQRSNRIVDEICVHLNEPDPFFLSLVSTHDVERDAVLKLLGSYKEGLTRNEILQKADLTKSLGYIVVNSLVRDKLIAGDGKYNCRYTLPKSAAPGTDFAERIKISAISI